MQVTDLPEWIRGKQISEADVEALRQCPVPDTDLAHLPAGKDLGVLNTPLTHMRAAAGMLLNMLIYYDAPLKGRLEAMLFVLRWARGDLDMAEEDIQKTLLEPEAKGVIPD